MSRVVPEIDKLVKLIERLDDDWYPGEDKTKAVARIGRWFDDGSNQTFISSFPDLKIIPDLLSASSITEENVIVSRQIAFKYANAKMYAVYKHTAPNSKVYVGITCQESEYRWQDGLGYSDNHSFYADIVKFGWENIKHELLYENLDAATACRIERDLISEYGSNDPTFGYNIDSGGRLPTLAKLWQYDHIRQYRGNRAVMKLVVPISESERCYAQIRDWDNMLIRTVNLQNDVFKDHLIVYVSRHKD